MITREFVGKNKEEVLEQALDILKLTKDKVKVEYEDENSILSFIKKKTIVKVTFNEDDMIGNRSLMFIRDLLEKMNLEAKIYLIEENDEKVVIEIESPDTALIIGKKGQTLEAIQTIVNVVMNKSAQKWTRVIIDIENYRNRRERSLQNLANNALFQVRKTKRSLLLEPMTPFERRTIHVTLQDEDDIETESVGEGIIKKVKINYINN